MNTTKSKAPTRRERIERNIVRDRKTGHYLVTLYSGYNAKGAIRSSKTYSTLAEAREAKKKHEYEHRYLGKRSSNTQITVAQCIEQYIAEKNLAETTKDNYRTRLKRIANHPLGKKKLVSVKVIDIERYMDEIEREGLLNSRSINGDWRLLHTIFTYAIKCEYITTNIVNGASTKPEKTFEGTALTREEIKTLIKAIDDCQDKHLKVVVCLGALQGMRRGEILGLKWEDIISTTKGLKISIQRERVPVYGGTILEKKPKTEDSERTMPSQPLTQKALEEYRSLQAELGIEGEYIVVSSKGAPLSPTRINNMFSKFLKQAGLPHIRLHDLRHTCCTLLIENGAKLAEAQKYLGHTSQRTTESIYTHLRDSVTDNTVSIFADIFGDM